MKSLSKFSNFMERTLCFWHVFTLCFMIPANKVGMIVGATVGSVLGFIFFLLVCVIFMFFFKRRREHEDDMANEIKWVHQKTFKFFGFIGIMHKSLACYKKMVIIMKSRVNFKFTSDALFTKSMEWFYRTDTFLNTVTKAPNVLLNLNIFAVYLLV